MDTRNKRASAIFPLLPYRVLLPAPDGAVGQADRQQVVFLYGGILAGVPAVSTYSTPDSRTYDVPFEDRTLPVSLDDRVISVPYNDRTYEVEA